MVYKSYLRQHFIETKTKYRTYLKEEKQTRIRHQINQIFTTLISFIHCKTKTRNSKIFFCLLIRLRHTNMNLTHHLVAPTWVMKDGISMQHFYSFFFSYLIFGYKIILSTNFNFNIIL